MSNTTQQIYNSFKARVNDLLIEYNNYRYNSIWDYSDIYTKFAELDDSYNEIKDDELQKLKLLEEYNKIYNDMESAWEWLENNDSLTKK